MGNREIIFNANIITMDADDTRCTGHGHGKRAYR